MFYSVQLLGKTSPLGKLWLAAHADKRLKRQDINSTDVPQSVEQIIHSEDNDNELPLALRLSGLLLLGLVKIYSRQLQYLQEDCLSAVQELDKADKLVANQRAHNKAQKASRTTLANQADVTVPDEPYHLFRFSSLSDEDSFGLFEENHAGLAMAAEAHASFMNLDFSLSQSDVHDDSAMVHLDEPEQLRAVHGDFDHEIGPMLPIGDDLPRMTPTKRKGRSASRDPSPEALPSRDKVPSSVGQASVPQPSQDEELMPAPLPMDYLPDLPPIMPRDSSGNISVPGSGAAKPAAEACAEAPVPDDVAMAGDPGNKPITDAGPGPMDDGIAGLNAGRNAPHHHDDEEEPAPNLPPINHDEDLHASHEPHEKAAPTHNRKRKQRITAKPETKSTDVTSLRRKRAVPKLRKDADKESTTIPSDEMRQLLKNRASLVCKLPPLVNPHNAQERHPHEDDLDILLMPSAYQEPDLDRRMFILFKAVGSCKPVSLQALRGETVHQDFRDEIEDAVQMHKPLHRNSNISAVPSDASQDVHILRADQPSRSGSHGAPPCIPKAYALDENEHDKTQDDAANAMLPEDDMDVMHAEVDAMLPMDIPFHPLPGLDEVGAAEAELRANAGTEELRNPDVDVHTPFENTPVETLYAAPGTQGTGGQEDTSLNAHTVRTLERLEILSQSARDTLKRKVPQPVAISQLIESTYRPEAAKLFYDVLVLQAKGIVQIQEQAKPYAELRLVLDGHAIVH